MAVEAPISKFSKTNLKIYIGVCIAAAVIFAYDGYLSRYKWSMRYGFYKKQVLDNDGKPTHTMIFNRKAPPFFLAGAVLFAVILYLKKDNKLIADENELIINNKKRIPYDSIQQIDKTHFEKKGFFIIIYKDKSRDRIKLGKNKYDNLDAVLEHLVAKIS
ncbi:MAG: hypothetical protein JW837_05175 [Sedimentisphaerales bacterium]|nr:hypothetical protein [Sedimentisphaerales bacterium]